MDIPLLQTKLYIPANRREFVSRSRLTEKLSQGLQGRLTLISAPAGFGKTSLISDWLGQSDRPAAWLSLDKNDNSLPRFFAYFIAAVQGVDAQIGHTVQNQLHLPQLPPAEDLLTLLINDIMAADQPFVLVLDDYHLIDATPVHDALTFLLEHCPPALHLMITSRADPPFSVAHWLARGEASEIHAQDLIFSAEEIAVLLNQINTLELSPTAIDALAMRTEGWIAGLQLAVLSLHRLAPEDRHAFVQNFAGNDRYILDYLMTEVLQQQSTQRQIFLLYTSLLTEFNADLIAMVTDSTPAEAQAMLSALDHENMFLISLDSWRESYRYHQLFADLLRSQLMQRHPDMIPTIHQRASEWYAAHNRLDLAIHHSLAAKDMTQVAHYLLSEDLLRHASPRQILDWLAQMPSDVLAAHPLLAIKHLWVLLETDQQNESIRTEHLAEVEERLQALEKNPEITRELTREMLVIRIHLARHRQEYDRAISLGQKLLAQLPASLPLNLVATKLGVVFGLAESYRLAGNLTAAQEQFSEAVRLSEIMGSSSYVLRAQLGLGEIYMARRDWEMARSILQKVLSAAAPDFTLELATAQDLLAEIPVRNVSAAPPFEEPLTARELDVLRWLDSELTVAEIGRQLFVSPNTTKTHVKNIYAKLGTHSRHETLIVAKERGLL